MEQSTLGQRVRELRMKIGMTQIDLAKGICTPSMISQIESDRARPSYKTLTSISERLEVPLDRLLMGVDLNLEYVSIYKMARAMVASKEYDSAIPLLLEVLGSSRSQISSMDIMFELGECYLYTKQFETAEEYLNQVRELALIRQDYLLGSKVLKHFGQMARERKKYQLAAFQWQMALEELDKLEERDVYLEADLLSRLGEVQVKRGYAAEATEYFERAVLLYGNHGSLNEMGQVYMGLGKTYQLMKDYQKASTYTELAAAIFESRDHLIEAIELQINNVALQARIGRLDEAEKALNQFIARLEDVGDREIRGVAHAELALVYMYKEEYGKAEENCKLARNLLPEMHLQQAKIERTVAGIAIGRGQIEEAVHWLQRAGERYIQQGETREYDQTMYDLTKLFRKQGDYQRMADALEQMRAVMLEALSQRGVEY